MGAIAGTWNKAMKGGKGGLIGIALSTAAALGVIGMIYSSINKAGDLNSPAKGKTMVSTKEGGLFELSPNDDLVAAPGASAALAGASGGGSVDMSPVVTAINGLKEQVSQLQTENVHLRNDMQSYFGLGGTVAKQIGSRTSQGIVEAGV